jgi:hypothetical protein
MRTCVGIHHLHESLYRLDRNGILVSTDWLQVEEIFLDLAELIISRGHRVATS